MRYICIFLLLASITGFAQTTTKHGTVRVKKVKKDYSLPELVTYTSFGPIDTFIFPTPVRSDTGTALYEGGEPAIRRFIAQTLRYPENSLYKGVKGSVDVTFGVDTLGKLSDIKLRGH